MEIRRFGTGHRRREGLAGARGVSGQAIHNDSRGNIAELAFASHASIPAHSNPNTTWFVVIEGGGFVQVGDERARVAAGEAVLWPANVVHAAWTEHSPMRVVVVEFAGDVADVPLLIEGRAAAAPEPTVSIERFAGTALDAARRDAESTAGSGPAGTAATELGADGSLAPKPPVTQDQYESRDREPW